MGMLGLQTAFSVVMETMVEAGLLDWRGVADRMSVQPARIGGVESQGQPIAVGSVANIVVIDPKAKWTVVPEELASKSSNTPYAERTVPGTIVHTFYAGRPTVIGGVLA